MPNYVFNTLRISGKKSDVEKVFQFKGKALSRKKHESLREFLGSHKLSMRSWFPMPKTFIMWDTTNAPCPQSYNRNTQKPFESDEAYAEYLRGYNSAKRYQNKKYGVHGWYDYNCLTLGCKWDADMEFLDCFDSGDGNIEVSFSFDTAWTAPANWLKSMVETYGQELNWSLESHEESNAFNEIIHYDDGGFWIEECESWYDEEDDECEFER